LPQAPKFEPARRNARSGPVKLPAEGREGDPPAWPLAGRVTAAERAAWADLWHTPQAVAWEKLGWTRTVARYCRLMVQAEKPNANAIALAEARQFEDRLGLTPKAMRLLLWEIVADEVAEQRAATDVRARIKAV